MPSSISIIIPALNEEKNLATTVAMVIEAIAPRFPDYELLVFDDGSQDRTGEIADRLAAENSNIRVIHHLRNMGLGYSFRKGIELAGKEHIGWLPGDSNLIFLPQDLERVFTQVGKADFVLIFVTTDARPVLRQLISQGFIHAMNLLFGLKVKYYNGANFFKRDVIKQMGAGLASDGYGLFSSLLIRLIKFGYSYAEIGVQNRDAQGCSKAIRLRSFCQVVQSTAKLFWDVRIRSSRSSCFRRTAKRPIVANNIRIINSPEEATGKSCRFATEGEDEAPILRGVDVPLVIRSSGRG